MTTGGYDRSNPYICEGSKRGFDKSSPYRLQIFILKLDKTRRLEFSIKKPWNSTPNSRRPKGSLKSLEKKRKN